MKTQILILLAFIGLLAAQDAGQIYCGRRLARTLAVLCSEDYLVKRSGNMKQSFYEAYNYEPGYVSPWLAMKEAHALNGGRGKRQQVVSECCEKPCTIEEMMTYCSN